MVGVVAATAELVPALRAAEVHAATFGQSVLEPAVRTGCKERREDTIFVFFITKKNPNVFETF